MEKIYMEAPAPTKMWRPTDISPYDFRDELSTNKMSSSQNNQQEEFDDEGFDMDAILNEMNMLNDEMENELYQENEMISHPSINDSCKQQTIQRKTIIEEENPKRTTTTWIKVTRCY